MIVYLIANLINNKKYVGVTKHTVTHRFSRHRWGKKSGLSTAIKKYGAENFSIEVLAEVDDPEEAFLLERKFIEEFQTYAPLGYGYNLSKGGSGGLGTPKTAEAKAKISAARRRFLSTPEGKSIASASIKNMRVAGLSPEVVRKRAESVKAAMKTSEWKVAHLSGIRGYLTSVVGKVGAADRQKRGVSARSQVALQKKIITCGPDHRVGYNLYIAPNGQKACRICIAANSRAYQARKSIATR